MEPKGSLPRSKEPAIRPYSEPDQSYTCLHHTSWRTILILSPYLRMSLCLYPSRISHPKPCVQLSPLPYVLRSSSISFQGVGFTNVKSNDRCWNNIYKFSEPVVGYDLQLMSFVTTDINCRSYPTTCEIFKNIIWVFVAGFKIWHTVLPENGIFLP